MSPAFDILGKEGDAQAPPPDHLAPVGLLPEGDAHVPQLERPAAPRASPILTILDR
jgi:hypothetical protein